MHSTYRGARRLRDGTAVERRPDDRRGAEHPRGLRPERDAARGRRCTTCSRHRAWRSPTAARTSPTADFFVVPRIGLLSKGFAATRRAAHRRRRRHEPRGAGDPYAFEAAARAPVEAAVTSTRAGTTTHITVADRRRRRRLLHVHDRVHRRRRPRRPRLRVPAQQRADGLQLHLANAPQPRPGRQAAAQLDGARRSSCATAGRGSASARPAGRRSSRRCSACSSSRIDFGMSLPAAIAVPRASQRDTPATRRRGRRSSSHPRRRCSPRAGTCSRITGEIGAATGVELLGPRTDARRRPSRCGAEAAARWWCDARRSR